MSMFALLITEKLETSWMSINKQITKKMFSKTNTKLSCLRVG